jgi:hypothetical protein
MTENNIVIEHSSDLGGIAKALSKVQGTIKSLRKDSAGYGYKYSSISEIADYVLPILSSNGIAVSQFGGGGRKLVTMLIHSETGQFLKGVVDLPPAEDMDVKGTNIAQKDGSLRTYYRRYSLCEMIGLTSNDEDTDAAPTANANKPANKKITASAAPAASKKEAKADDDLGEKKAAAPKKGGFNRIKAKKDDDL